MINKSIFKLLLALFSILTLSANAATFQLSGEVTFSSSVLAELFPVGSPLFGPVVMDDAAVNAGLAVAPDIISIDVNVGGFCFSTQTPSACPAGGADVPLTEIDAATFNFTGGVPTGGNLFLWFSPLPDVVLPMIFDFNDGVFFIDGGDAGTVFGNATLVAAPIPVPGAIWLMGSALFGLLGLRRQA